MKVGKKPYTFLRIKNSFIGDMKCLNAVCRWKLLFVQRNYKQIEPMKVDQVFKFLQCGF